MAIALRSITMPLAPTPGSVTLRTLRLSSQYVTQRELAQAADIHPTNLSKIERGKQKPSAEHITGLARALNVTEITIKAACHMDIRAEDTEGPQHGAPSDRPLPATPDLVSAVLQALNDRQWFINLLFSVAHALQEREDARRQAPNPGSASPGRAAGD